MAKSAHFLLFFYHDDFALRVLMYAILSNISGCIHSLCVMTHLQKEENENKNSQSILDLSEFKEFLTP